MAYPKIIKFKTRHYNFQYIANNLSEYKKIGLSILSDLKENHFLFECNISKDTTQKEYLEEKFDLPFKDIDRLYKSKDNKYIKLLGKKSKVYESGYETPSGSNIIDQVNSVIKNYRQSKLHNKYLKSALEVIKKKQEDKAWDLVDFFAHDNVNEEYPDTL